MKKLLSLLSIITISGTAIPTTIAASPYQNDKTKLENSKINYSQTNNLEILNRKKREKNISKNSYLEVIIYIFLMVIIFLMKFIMEVMILMVQFINII